MVRATAGDVHTATAHAVDDGVKGDVYFQNIVKHHARIFHRVGLWNGSWETVKQKPFGAIGLGDTFFDQTDDDVIADQSAGIHDFFGR